MKKSINFFKHLILTYRLLVLAITTLATANSFGQIPPPEEFLDTITFEEAYPHLTIDSSEQNIWHRAKPNKAYLDSAYSAQYAMITDSTSGYPANNLSWFEIQIGDFNYPDMFPFNIFMEFVHKYDTDTLEDGGFITVSYDNGQTWWNIFENYWPANSYPYPENYYIFESHNLYSQLNTLTNDSLGFSGNSHGWVETIICWYVPLVKKSTSITNEDTLRVRFNFVSDNNDNGKEGWMIDDIILYFGDIPGATHTTDISDKVRLHPNPVNDLATITLDRNYNTINLSILSSDGRVISRSTHYRTNKFTIKTSDLAPGVYFVSITMDGGLVAVKKVVR